MHLAGLEGGGARVASLISVLAEGVEPLIYLHGAKGRFSIKEWVNRPLAGNATDSGFLFLSAPESHMDALRPLLGFWSELAVSALLSRHDTPRTTTWFVLDEFHSAGKIEKLADGPQRLRKYGGAVVLGFQQVSQLQDLYGPDKAKTIIGQCQTKLILRAGDFDTATLMSDQLGRRVMRRVEENTSYGANSIRDGVGLTPKEELEPVVLPEDVQNFPKFQGMIRVSNARASKPFPIAPIKLEYIARKEVATGFVQAAADPVRDYIARQVSRSADRRGNRGPDSQQKGDPTAPTGLGPKPPANGPPQGEPAQVAERATSAPAVATRVPASARGPKVDQAVDIAALFRPLGTIARRPEGENTTAPATSTEGAADVASQSGPADAAGQTEARSGQADGGGPEPALETSDVPGAGEDEGAAEPGTQKEMRPRRIDLPNDESERLRRREEEDETYRNMRTAELRREPDSDRTRTSVMQREGEMLREEEGRGEYLGSLDTATQAEVAYAEQHRHEILETIVEVGVGGVVGGNVDFRDGSLAGAADEVQSQPLSYVYRSDPDVPDMTLSADDQTREVGPEVRASDVGLRDTHALDAPDQPDVSVVNMDTWIGDLRHRHRKHHHHKDEAEAEHELQPDLETGPKSDPDRDREPELEIDR